MPYVSGFLIEGPVDPGFGNRPGGGGEHPDQGLPGGGYPSHPIVLPPAPPGIWPPPSVGNPILPLHPDNTLPVQPGTIWPSPGRPDRPDNTLPGGGLHPGGGPMPGGDRPNQGLPGGPGGVIDNTLPSQTFWMLAYCPSLGWKFIAVDPSLRPGMPLPPSAQPK